MSRLRVLHITRNYPNSVFPRLGLWTERLLRSTLGECEAEVIAPVPYWPPLPGPDAFTRYRRVARETEAGGVRVHHPRFFVGPGSWLSEFEGVPFHAACRRVADRLQAQRPCDLIHAHFVYPDGWAAARLARRYNVPLVVTEQASWQPWMDNAPRVRRHAVQVAAQSRFVMAVSHSLARAISHFAELGDRLRVIPNVVDEEVFTLPNAAEKPKNNRLLFVGLIRRVKGLDVLLSAVHILVQRGYDVSLAVVGESIYGSYQVDLNAARQQVITLGLEARVSFLGGMAPLQVAQEMWKSRMLVLPSRRETFAAVVVEALACGLPVVATRCGGPEDIMTDEVGLLVAAENPGALADGIAAVLDGRKHYAPAALRAYAVERFGMRAVGAQLVSMYREAVAPGQGSR